MHALRNTCMQTKPKVVQKKTERGKYSASREPCTGWADKNLVGDSPRAVCGCVPCKTQLWEHRWPQTHVIGLSPGGDGQYLFRASHFRPSDLLMWDINERTILLTIQLTLDTQCTGNQVQIYGPCGFEVHNKVPGSMEEQYSMYFITKVHNSHTVYTRSNDRKSVMSGLFFCFLTKCITVNLVNNNIGCNSYSQILALSSDLATLFYLKLVNNNNSWTPKLFFGPTQSLYSQCWL